MTIVVCLHCGDRFVTRGGAADKHAQRCPRDPALRDAIVRALTGADGYAASHNQYMAAAQRDNLPSRTALSNTFGSWAAALAHFGAVVSPQRANHAARIAATRVGRDAKMAAVDARVGAEIDALTEEAQRELEYAAYLSERGLAVCGERRLPGGGMAYMLR